MYKKFYLNEEKNQAIQDWGNNLTLSQCAIIKTTRQDFWIEADEEKTGLVKIKFDNDI